MATWKERAGCAFPTARLSFFPRRLIWNHDHLDSLREGAETVAEQPWGYGVGNAGVTAKRTGAEIRAGFVTDTYSAPMRFA